MPELPTTERYSTFTGFVYIFNIIVGTGALTIPGAFSKTGWLLGVILVTLVGFAGYITVTFIIESLSVVNALNRMKQLKNVQDNSDNEEYSPLVPQTNEDDDSNSLFLISEKYELGEMAVVLLPRMKRVILYSCICIYLFGDLAIYCAVVSRTLSHVTCTYRHENQTCNNTIPDSTLCWAGSSLTRNDMYKLYIVGFVLLLGPFVFFNVQKTKILQLFTSLVRWAAFTIMIVWSFQKLIVFGKQGNPPVVDFYMLPSLFGSCVYSFMCHHSVPSLIHPIQNKLKLKQLVCSDYLLIASFYIVLAVTGCLAFSHVEDLYTLNFWPDNCSNYSEYTIFLDYFLALFPVFALSTSYPIIGITLRNNLKFMILSEGEHSMFVDRILFPIVVILPPAILAILVNDLQMLVGIIGSYAGAGVQYLIPCLLVSAAREHLNFSNQRNSMASPFSGKVWVFGIYSWMTLSLLLITVNYTTYFR